MRGQSQKLSDLAGLNIPDYSRDIKLPCRMIVVCGVRNIVDGNWYRTDHIA